MAAGGGTLPGHHAAQCLPAAPGATRNAGPLPIACGGRPLAQAGQPRAGDLERRLGSLTLDLLDEIQDKPQHGWKLLGMDLVAGRIKDAQPGIWKAAFKRLSEA